MNDDSDIPLRLRIVRGPDELQDDAQGIDAAIPMLTEVMDFPKLPESGTDPMAVPVLPPQLSQSLDWNALRQSLQANILESLLEKSDAFLAREFQERVKPLLERTVASMVQDLHIHLEQVLRDAVASAITDELNKLQSPRDPS